MVLNIYGCLRRSHIIAKKKPAANAPMTSAQTQAAGEGVVCGASDGGVSPAGEVRMAVGGGGLFTTGAVALAAA